MKASDRVRLSRAGIAAVVIAALAGAGRAATTGTDVDPVLIAAERRVQEAGIVRILESAERESWDRNRLPDRGPVADAIRDAIALRSRAAVPFLLRNLVVPAEALNDDDGPRYPCAEAVVAIADPIDAVPRLLQRIDHGGVPAAVPVVARTLADITGTELACRLLEEAASVPRSRTLRDRAIEIVRADPGPASVTAAATVADLASATTTIEAAPAGTLARAAEASTSIDDGSILHHAVVEAAIRRDPAAISGLASLTHLPIRATDASSPSEVAAPRESVADWKRYPALVALAQIGRPSTPVLLDQRRTATDPAHRDHVDAALAAIWGADLARAIPGPRD